MTDPIEDGVQQAYVEIKDSLRLLVSDFLDPDTVNEVLDGLDDAISNNWDELMLSFWRGVKCGVGQLEDVGSTCRKCGSAFTADGFCVDQTCPYSDHLQHETWTEG